MCVQIVRISLINFKGIRAGILDLNKLKGNLSIVRQITFTIMLLQVILVIVISKHHISNNVINIK